MVGTMQKIKNALTPGHRHDHTAGAYDNTATGTYGNTAGTGYTGTGYNETGMNTGVAGQPAGYTETVVGTNAAAPMATESTGVMGGHHHHHHQHGGYAGAVGTGAAVVHEGVEAEICNRREYVEVEDRPILKERVERIVEHQPVEKRFIVETRPAGETLLAERAHVESAGVTERVIDRAEGTVCPTGTVPVATGMGGMGTGMGGMGTTVTDARSTTTYDRCADGSCARP